MKKNRYTLWEELRKKYNEHRDEIRSRLDDFRRVPPEKYIYELAYCLLTPQSSALHAASVQRQLEKRNFHRNNIDPEPFLRRKENYIRFHRTKARSLVLMKAQFPEILLVLNSRLSGYEIREWLVGNVRGCSYKESTHFLRNIGKNEGLAILDRHILRKLAHLRIISSVPKTMTKKQYLALEQKFQQFSYNIGITVDELDLLFWSEATGVILK